MRAITLGLALAIGVAATLPGAGVAQTAAPTPPAGSSGQDAAGNAGQVKQIPLTPALVDQFLAAETEMDAVLDKLPDGTDQPDPATLSKLDAVAKKHKFDDYNQYRSTEDNIGLVMAGMDPTTKKYVGPEMVIKKQIAEIQAGNQVSAKDKKDMIDRLNATIPTMPKLQYPENIDPVSKNFDKLNEDTSQD